MADFRGQLLRLNRELLFIFVELLGTLADAPSGYARGVEALGLVVRNMHYLLNALRAQQVSVSYAPFVFPLVSRWSRKINH